MTADDRRGTAGRRSNTGDWESARVRACLRVGAEGSAPPRCRAVSHCGLWCVGAVVCGFYGVWVFCQYVSAVTWPWRGCLHLVAVPATWRVCQGRVYMYCTQAGHLCRAVYPAAALRGIAQVCVSWYSPHACCRPVFVIQAPSDVSVAGPTCFSGRCVYLLECVPCVIRFSLSLPSCMFVRAAARKFFS